MSLFGTPKTQERMAAPKEFPIAGLNRPYGAIWGNQYAQVGFLADMWADLIEGYREKVDEFYEAFRIDFLGRDMSGLGIAWMGLQTFGLFAPTREMLFIHRDPVTVTVYFARQGNDLYISWRAFIQTAVSWLRITILILAIVAVSGWDIFFGSGYSFYPTSYIQTIIINRLEALSLIVFVPIFLYGFFYRNGDWLSLLRQSVHELYIDDMIALSLAVHNSIFAAADTVGIDTATLKQHEPFHLPRNRSKLRF